MALDPSAYARPVPWFRRSAPKQELPDPLDLTDAEQECLRWVDASHALGTEIAVHGQPGDILLYPTNVVAKRWVAHEYGFLPTLVAAALERLGQIRDASERSHSDKPFELGWWSA